MASAQVVRGRNRRETGAIRNVATFYFTVTIIGIGAILMSVTSSPTAKGASFLWLPAALQLIAGVWLGPVRGAIAGGIGAYGAGIICYGGWDLRNIIMNLIAGGLTNAMLPALLFRAFKIDPSMGFTTEDGDRPATLLKVGGRLFILLWAVVIVAFLLERLNLGLWGYVGPFALLVIYPLFLVNTKLPKPGKFLLAFAVVIFASGCSALLGSYGQVVAGQPWMAAIIGTGLGWFLGNSTSCILGLYVLALFTHAAQEAGLCDPVRPEN